MDKPMGEGFVKFKTWELPESCDDAKRVYWDGRTFGCER